MIRAALLGKHSHRTPLSYRPYQALAAARGAFEIVPPDAPADLLVVGFERDLSESVGQIRECLRRNPEIRIAVLSEEPLWDSLWSPRYRELYGMFTVDGADIPLIRINHVTTDVFRFDRIPYFITTSDDYFLRYQIAFKQRSREPGDEVVKRWRGAPKHVAFCAEKRIGSKYQVEHREFNIVGLCEFRTRVAMATPDSETVRMGVGWSDSSPRQALPDWHLDKLSGLAGRFRVVSALENTHCPGYITEKLFDSFAVGAIPVYCASEDQGVDRLIQSPCVLNTWSATPEEAASAIMAMSPSRSLAESYKASVMQLSQLFRNPEFLLAERLRVLDAISGQLFEFMAGLVPRKNVAPGTESEAPKPQLVSVAGG